MKKLLYPDFLYKYNKRSLLKNLVYWVSRPAYLFYYLMVFICFFMILGAMLPMWFSPMAILNSSFFIAFSFCVFLLFKQGKLNINKISPREQFLAFLINLFFFTVMLATSVFSFWVLHNRVVTKIGGEEVYKRDRDIYNLFQFQKQYGIEQFKKDYKEYYFELRGHLP